MVCSHSLEQMLKLDRATFKEGVLPRPPPGDFWIGNWYSIVHTYSFAPLTSYSLAPLPFQQFWKSQFSHPSRIYCMQPCWKFVANLKWYNTNKITYAMYTVKAV